MTEKPKSGLHDGELSSKRAFPRVPLETILSTARDHLDGVGRWVDQDRFDLAADYYSKAKGLVELAEVQTCGSYGGYGRGQTASDRATLHTRIEWLEANYTDMN